MVLPPVKPFRMCTFTSFPAARENRCSCTPQSGSMRSNCASTPHVFDAGCRFQKLPITRLRSRMAVNIECYASGSEICSTAPFADASLGSDFRLRCAALTAPWSWAISFSLRSGGAASSVVGRSFRELPPRVLFDMSFRSPKPLASRKNASERRPAQDAFVLDQTMLECTRRNGGDYVASSARC
jgi:hypothetical protein